MPLYCTCKGLLQTDVMTVKGFLGPVEIIVVRNVSLSELRSALSTYKMVNTLSSMNPGIPRARLEARISSHFSAAVV